MHFFLCLVKHRNQVIATQMVSTKDSISNGGFSFPNLINIRDLDQDFNIVIELYTLKTKRESIAKQHQKTLASRRVCIRLGSKVVLKPEIRYLIVVSILLPACL